MKHTSEVGFSLTSESVVASLLPSGGCLGKLEMSTGDICELSGNMRLWEMSPF